MRFLIFVALLFVAMGVSGFYGALHDQISFTVSSEYFTKFKYQQFGFVHSGMPDRAKAACIGFLATWWMGIPIGVLVGLFGFLHKQPQDMFRRTLKAYCVVAGVALIVGLFGLAYGWFFPRREVDYYSGWYLPDNLLLKRNFLAVGYMHNFSYLGGVIGIFIGIITQFVLRRKPMQGEQVVPPKSDRTGG